MTTRLLNKVCIITGAASGMGASEATEFAKNGAKVIIADLDFEKATALADSINAEGGTAYPFQVLAPCDTCGGTFRKICPHGQKEIRYNRGCHRP